MRDHIMQFFTYSHLQKDLQAIGKPFCELAATIHETVAPNPERSVALRKLLEAKDAILRAIPVQGSPAHVKAELPTPRTLLSAVKETP